MKAWSDDESDGVDFLDLSKPIGAPILKSIFPRKSSNMPRRKDRSFSARKYRREAKRGVQFENVKKIYSSKSSHPQRNKGNTGRMPRLSECKRFKKIVKDKYKVAQRLRENHEEIAYLKMKLENDHTDFKKEKKKLNENRYMKDQHIECLKQKIKKLQYRLELGGTGKSKEKKKKKKKSKERLSSISSKNSEGSPKNKKKEKNENFELKEITPGKKKRKSEDNELADSPENPKQGKSGKKKKKKVPSPKRGKKKKGESRSAKGADDGYLMAQIVREKKKNDALSEKLKNHATKTIAHNQMRHVVSRMKKDKEKLIKKVNKVTQNLEAALAELALAKKETQEDKDVIEGMKRDMEKTRAQQAEFQLINSRLILKIDLVEREFESLKAREEMLTKKLQEADEDKLRLSKRVSELESQIE